MLFDFAYNSITSKYLRKWQIERLAKVGTLKHSEDSRVDEEWRGKDVEKMDILDGPTHTDFAHYSAETRQVRHRSCGATPAQRHNNHQLRDQFRSGLDSVVGRFKETLTILRVYAVGYMADSKKL